MKPSKKLSPKPKKELQPIEDKIQQIFKFLEIADVSQWQGMNVFEAGDADSLYGILKTALEKTYQEGYEKHKKMMEDRIYEFGEYDPKGCLAILCQMDEPEPVEY